LEGWLIALSMVPYGNTWQKHLTGHTIKNQFKLFNDYTLGLLLNNKLIRKEKQSEFDAFSN